MTSIRIASARGDLGVAAFELEQAEHDATGPGCTIAELRHGHRDTVEMPAVPMAELVESRP